MRLIPPGAPFGYRRLVRRTPWWVLPVCAGMVVLFLAYSGVVYRVGMRQHGGHLRGVVAQAGRRQWQARNCVACHQLYGLGGFRGPDLTNIMSHSDRGEAYVRAVLRFGMGAMPDFHLTEQEIDALVEFLRAVDASGTFPAPAVAFTWYGDAVPGERP